MATITENLAELFFSKLKTATNSGVVLAQFYGALMGIEVGRSEIINFSKLAKVFGRTSVFFAIIDISRKESFPEFPYGLLHTICRSKLEKTLEIDGSMPAQFSLEKLINSMEKEISTTKRIDPDKASKYLEGQKESK